MLAQSMREIVSSYETVLRESPGKAAREADGTQDIQAYQLVLLIQRSSGYAQVRPREWRMPGGIPQRANIPESRLIQPVRRECIRVGNRNNPELRRDTTGEAGQVPGRVKSI